MHLVLARDILPNNTSAIRPRLAPSVQQQGRGRAPSSPITDGTDYLGTVRPELGRDYQNPVRTAWTAVRTGLCGTLQGREAIVRLLLEVKSDISAVASERKSALHIAPLRGPEESAVTTCTLLDRSIVPLSATSELIEMYTLRPHAAEAECGLVIERESRRLLLCPALDEQDGETIAEFERVRPAILAILEDTDAGPSWFLTAARYEARPRPSTPLVIPTIILFCTNPQRCRRKLEALETPLRLEVKQGEATFNVSDVLSPENPDHAREVPMGSSTGVKGVRSSGTFGGYVFEKSSRKRFGITNGHVAAMHLKEEASLLPVTVRAEDEVTMVQNSDEDHCTRLEWAESDWQAAIAEDEMYGGQRERSRNERAAAGAEVERLRNLDRRLGTVEFAELGITETEDNQKCWKDIALIDVAKGCTVVLRLRWKKC